MNEGDSAGAGGGRKIGLPASPAVTAAQQSTTPTATHNAASNSSSGSIHSRLNASSPSIGIVGTVTHSAGGSHPSKPHMASSDEQSSSSSNSAIGGPLYKLFSATAAAAASQQRARSPSSSPSAAVAVAGVGSAGIAGLVDSLNSTDSSSNCSSVGVSGAVFKSEEATVSGGLRSALDDNSTPAILVNSSSSSNSSSSNSGGGSSVSKPPPCSSNSINNRTSGHNRNNINISSNKNNLSATEAVTTTSTAATITTSTSSGGSGSSNSNPSNTSNINSSINVGLSHQYPRVDGHNDEGESMVIDEESDCTSAIRGQHVGSMHQQRSDTQFGNRSVNEPGQTAAENQRERIVAIKKRILEHKQLHLKSLKEKHTEHVAEIFFLQSGGNMMEYPAWRKKPQTPELINFMRSYRLDQAHHTDDAATAAKQQSIPPTPAHGTEIKIPGVGATPVALSTQLPAAVVQLSQQGGTPLVPDQDGMDTSSICSSSNIGTPLSSTKLLKRSHSPLALATCVTPSTPSINTGNIHPGTPTTPLNSNANNNQYRNSLATNSLHHSNGESTGTGLFQVPSPTNGNSNNSGNGNGTGSQDQFSVKARQEVYVMQRVTELQRDGLWTEKRLPKLQEPTRPKAHWDYVLEEMVWLSADFAQERKWKKACAKKCARMVQKYFQDKAVAAQRAEKAQEAQLRRLAAFVAKEIKCFWSNVEKLVEYKQHTKLEEKRKKALDQHLSFIVDQTEKFSQQLAEGMNKGVVAAESTVASRNSSRISSPSRLTNVDDEEFSPGNESSSDDEETIAKEEEVAAGHKDTENVDDEVLALQRESQMDLDDFLNELPKDYLANRDKIVLPDSDDEVEEEDKEFEANDDSTDDEDTIQEQEQAERGENHKREIAELEEENELSIEALMEKYKGMTKEEKMEVDSNMTEDEDDMSVNESQANAEGDDDEEASENEDEDVEEGDSEDDGAEKSQDEMSLKNLLNDSMGDNNDQLIDDAAAIAESIQPKGNTLSSTNVVTDVPFLLKHSLREYQHIGLDWLVTMHDRKLNGILADEMGLGKTIQTISLLAHLACVKGNWGPHLIIVPSSVMLNWEMEFKKWCPGFKILTYYGAQKERKAKRVGWTKVNTFHICITSYKLVIQDHQSFRRKKWKYLILDEAQNIKNFKSQRWQLLLNFQTEQRLLLTGTPLQNNLMELWSLMHFLMPHVFQSHKEFKEWFSNPMTGMIEGNSEYNDSIVKRLHKVLRPFLLRRLKSEVEKQMPKKYEHVVMCRLSKRQRYLYDDFMSRAKTRETLASGNLLSVINVLMQLRKVCNHPNLFEVRPTISPFRTDGIVYKTASLVTDLFHYDPMRDINLQALNLDLMNLELSTTAYVAYRSKKLSTPKRLIEEIDMAPELPPQCPSGKFRMHIKVAPALRDDRPTNNSQSAIKVGTSPVMRYEGNKFIPLHQFIRDPPPLVHSSSPVSTSIIETRRRSEMIVQSSHGRHLLITSGAPVVTHNGQRLTVVSSPNNKNLSTTTKMTLIKQPLIKLSPLSNSTAAMQQTIAAAVGQQLRNYTAAQAKAALTPAPEEMEVDEGNEYKEFIVAETEEFKKEHRINQLKALGQFNEKHCDANPIYGEDLRSCVQRVFEEPSSTVQSWVNRGSEMCRQVMWNRSKYDGSLIEALKTYEERTRELKPIFENFVTFVPSVSAPRPILHISHPHPSRLIEDNRREQLIREEMSPKLVLLHPIMSAMSTQFPDPRLIQYDCGKLQTMNHLLRRLKTGGHRVLIFTQMTRMLDVLEAFLNYHGHIYLRLDGTTKVEQRQILMERFNGDKRIFAFILSTRSGGVGVNLTGADTVIFYDSDWNPTMDAQAQDRCHRIGQTRDVHIYRMVSEKTIEENILKKANQKRLLGDLAIEGGNFTTAFFKSSTIQDLFHVNNDAQGARLQELVEMDKERKERLNEAIAGSSSGTTPPTNVTGIYESALQAAEDEQDVEAAKTAQAEVDAELAEFDENIPIEEDGAAAAGKPQELSKAEQEVQQLMKQLSPIERYAMRFVEDTGGHWTAEQLKAAEAEIEQQKREWEANRQAALAKAEEEQRQIEEEEFALTYSSEDAKNQVKSKIHTPNNRTKSRGGQVTANHSGSGGTSSSSSGSNNHNSTRRYNERGNNNSHMNEAATTGANNVATNRDKRQSGRTSLSLAAAEQNNNNNGKRNCNKGGTDGRTLNNTGNNVRRNINKKLDAALNSNGNGTTTTTTMTTARTKPLSPAVNSSGGVGKRISITNSRIRMADESNSNNSSKLEMRRSLRGRSVASNYESESSAIVGGSGGGGGTERPAAKVAKLSSSSSNPSHSNKTQENGHCGDSEEDEEHAVRGDSDPLRANNNNYGNNNLDESDSECSLDVMIDSNDAANETDSNRTGNDNDSLNSLHMPSTSSIRGGGGGGTSVNHDAGTDCLNSESLPVNSPRTRSRGSVKINLWTLDESPLAVVKKTRSRVVENNSDDSDDEDNKSLDELKRIAEKRPVTLSNGGDGLKKDMSLSPPSRRRKVSNSGGSGESKLSESIRMTRRSSILTKDIVSIGSP